MHGTLLYSVLAEAAKPGETVVCLLQIPVKYVSVYEIDVW